jgi:hypothetical protein
MQYKNITGFLKIRSKLKIDRRGFTMMEKCLLM